VAQVRAAAAKTAIRRSFYLWGKMGNQYSGSPEKDWYGSNYQFIERIWNLSLQKK
jgi:hypothetical protein